MSYLVNIVILLLLIAGIFYFQVLLSGSRIKWLGVVLPILTFIGSLLIVGHYILNETDIGALTEVFQSGMGAGEILGLLLVLLLINIPTIILLVIYGIRQQNRPGRRSGLKMNVRR